MTPPAEPLPPPGFADVRITAASPETARMIAQVLRVRFAATEQGGSSPAVDDGTRLRLRVDTVHVPEASGPFQLRLVGGRRDTVREETEPPDRGKGGPGRERPRAAPPAVRPAPELVPAPQAPSGTTRPPTTGDSSGDRPAT
jgi:hypothetical protein